LESDILKIGAVASRCKVVCGLVVPIATLPSLVILILSAKALEPSGTV
jgi:hypothetical protein